MLSQLNKWSGGDGKTLGAEFSKAAHETYAPLYDELGREMVQNFAQGRQDDSTSSNMRLAGRFIQDEAAAAMSDAAKLRDQAYEQTEGFGALDFLVRNPGKVFDMVLENLPAQAPLLAVGYGGGAIAHSFAAGRYAISKGEFATFVRAKGYQTEAERGDGCVAWNGKEWKKDAAYNWRNVGFAQADSHPVVCVSWNDAQAYIAWLNQSSGQIYRLLSEAEREYAARGGTQTAFWWGSSINTAQANYEGNYSYNGSPKGEYRQTTVPVNSFSPNPFGLYNVHGNVWEWTQDCWSENYTGAPTDGSAWATGDCRFRVLRGGSWLNVDPAFLRSAYRDRDAPVNRDTSASVCG